jgi:signal peptidase II
VSALTNRPNQRRFYGWLSLACLVLILDQSTKLWAQTSLQFAVPVPVTGFLNWSLIYNPGAAFSFLANGDGWQRWFFTVLGTAAAIFMIWYLRRHQNDTLLSLAISFILGGAVGNVIDRLVYGAVVDFIDLYYGQWHWPAFNLADSAIVFGAALIIWGEIRPKRASTRA